MELLSHLALVVFMGYGMAVLLVEMKRKWPIRRYHILFKKLLKRVHPRAPKMLTCAVCTSFWTTLVAELGLLLLDMITGWHIRHAFQLWLWPFSGFVTCAFTWTVMDILRSLGFIADSLTIISTKKD